jgi:RNA binding exosome subunit
MGPLVQREIRSVEVSVLIHATEDEEKVRAAIESHLKVASEPRVENLEGFFGSRIMRMVWHVTGEDAWRCFTALMVLLGRQGRAEIVRELESHLDEHSALYVRLSKQALMGGAALLVSEDPVRVKVKPRGYMMKGGRSSFYSRLIEGAS